MKTYDVICPNCGHVNQSLYLDETNGWMECEECGMTHRVSLKDRRKGCVSLPVIMEGSTRLGVAFSRQNQNTKSEPGKAGPVWRGAVTEPMNGRVYTAANPA